MSIKSGNLGNIILSLIIRRKVETLFCICLFPNLVTILYFILCLPVIYPEIIFLLNDKGMKNLALPTVHPNQVPFR